MLKELWKWRCKIGAFIDLTGQKFGKLTVVKRVEDYISPKRKRQIQWLCKCDCGNEIVVNGNSLKKGYTKSCGCIVKELITQRNKKYNTYDLSGDYGIGYTLKGKEFWFDKEDYNLIKDYCWRIDKDGFVVATIAGTKGKSIYLHRIILPDSVYVDHKEHNRFDNRKEKLRKVTPSQNGMNKSLRKNNTSGVSGVHFDNRINKWIARIQVDNKRIALGRFDIFKDAVKARKKAEEKYFGEYSYDNSMKGAM